MIDSKWARGLDLGGDGLINTTSAMARGYSYIIHRVIRENGHVDRDCKENIRRCLANGLTIGTYFWPGPDHGNKFLDAMEWCRADWPKMIPPAIDLENNRRQLSARDYWAEAHQNIVDIEKAWNPTGDAARHSLIYGPRSFLTEMLPDSDPNVAAHPLWLAHPGDSPGPIPPPWTDWLIWQNIFGEEGGPHVPDCTGGLDANVFRGSHQDLVARFGLRS